MNFTRLIHDFNGALGESDFMLNSRNIGSVDQFFLNPNVIGPVKVMGPVSYKSWVATS